MDGPLGCQLAELVCEIPEAQNGKGTESGLMPARAYNGSYFNCTKTATAAVVDSVPKFPFLGTKLWGGQRMMQEYLTNKMWDPYRRIG